MELLTTQEVADRYGTSAAVIRQIARRELIKPTRMIGTAALWTEDQARQLKPRVMATPPKTIALIKRLRKQGKSLQQVADVVNLHPATVSRLDRPRGKRP